MLINKLESELTRRNFLRTSVLAAVGGALGFPGARKGMAAPMEGMHAAISSIALSDLPYAYDALEPTIDARTMEIHHGRHHAAYVRNVVESLKGASRVCGATAGGAAR